MRFYHGNRGTSKLFSLDKMSVIVIVTWQEIISWIIFYVCNVFVDDGNAIHDHYIFLFPENIFMQGWALLNSEYADQRGAREGVSQSRALGQRDFT